MLLCFIVFLCLFFSLLSLFLSHSISFQTVTERHLPHRDGMGAAFFAMNQV